MVLNTTASIRGRVTRRGKSARHVFSDIVHDLNKVAVNVHCLISDLYLLVVVNRLDRTSQAV